MAAALRSAVGRASHDAGHARAAAPRAGEWALALIVVTGALALRAWRMSTLGLNHYDEGVYMLSALGLADASQPFTLFPGQALFSPPLYFTAVSLMHQISGLPIDVSAILLNIGMGTATVVLVWWVGRLWFGPRAGLAAAALLALSHAHITLSRVALTDVFFSLLFLLTVALLITAVEKGSVRWAFAAGLAGGLVWNTKVHGWFTLLVTGLSLVPALWYERRRLGVAGRSFALWLIAALVAGVMYVPWALYIRLSGGHVQLARYYMTLIDGEWLANLWRHVQQQMYLEGPLASAAPLIACAIVLLGAPRSSWTRLGLALPVIAVASWLFGFFGIVSVLALFAVPGLLRDFASYRSRVLLAWLGLWVVAAPIYHPYARLLLPFTVLTCMLAGAWLARGTKRLAHAAPPTPDRSTTAEPAPRSSGAPAALASGAALALALGVGVLARPTGGNPWRAARDLVPATDAIAEIVPENGDVYVLGEPPLAFYVTVSGRAAFRSAGPIDLDTIGQAAWLVTGVYTDRAPNLASEVEARTDRLTRVLDIPFRPNDLRLLDDFTPAEARAYLALPDSTFDLAVYRVVPR